MKASPTLAAGFAAFDEVDWHAAVSRFGKGAAPAPAPLSDDGIPIGPIHRRLAGATPIAMRAAGKRWRIIQRVAARDPATVLARCHDEMAGGADGIVLVFDATIDAWAGGAPVACAAAIAAGLRDMQPAALFIDAGPRTAEIAPTFAGAATECSLAFDPIAAAAAGRLADAGSAVAALAARAGSFAGRLVLADGRVWHAAGASEAQELAAVLATVIDQIRLFEAAGIAADDAAARIGVAMAVDADQFLTTAKLRAVRLLLARALEVAGIDRSIPVHAETAWRMMSRREPRMNVLRTTGAAFAAAVGGADSITVLPFDALDDDGSSGARRLARNTQLVIAEECQLFRFVDPAAGSGAVEILTDVLAEKAWARFQAIEAAGGMLAALASGGLQAEIAATRAARLGRVAARDIEMIGVNAFVAESGTVSPPAPGITAAAGSALLFRRLAEAAEAGA